MGGDRATEIDIPHALGRLEDSERIVRWQHIKDEALGSRLAEQFHQTREGYAITVVRGVIHLNKQDVATNLRRRRSRPRPQIIDHSIRVIKNAEHAQNPRPKRQRSPRRQPNEWR